MLPLPQPFPPLFFYFLMHYCIICFLGRDLDFCISKACFFIILKYPQTFFVPYPNAKRKIYYCYNDRSWLIVETDLVVNDGGPSPTFCIENAVFSLV